MAELKQGKLPEFIILIDRMVACEKEIDHYRRLATQKETEHRVVREEIEALQKTALDIAIAQRDYLKEQLQKVCWAFKQWLDDPLTFKPSLQFDLEEAQ